MKSYSSPTSACVVARGQAGVGAGQQRAQVQLEAAFDDRGPGPAHCGAGRTGPVAGRLQARGETTGQRVDAFGDGQHRPAATARCHHRRSAAGRPRRWPAPPLPAHHRPRQWRPAMPCSSGNSLTMRDCRSFLASSAARLACTGSAPTCGAITSARTATRATLVGHAAQLGLVSLQAVAHRRQALLQVLVEEELASAKRGRITRSLATSATSFDSMLAMPMNFGQGAGGIQHREELLVDLHRFDQCFLRHCQEGAFEAAQHRRRPLDQVHHLLQVVADGAATALAAAASTSATMRARRSLGSHEGAQGFNVILRLGQRHGLVVVEAMATADMAQAEQLGLHHLGTRAAASQCAGRAKPQVVAPAHRLESASPQSPRAGSPQQAGGAAPGSPHGARSAHPCCRWSSPARSSRSRAWRSPATPWLAFGVQCDVQVRAQHFAVLFRLFQANARQQHQPARVDSGRASPRSSATPRVRSPSTIPSKNAWASPAAP